MKTEQGERKIFELQPEKQVSGTSKSDQISSNPKYDYGAPVFESTSTTRFPNTVKDAMQKKIMSW